MQWWRSRLGTLAHSALGLFLAVVAVPRAGLVVHTHAGGDHVHVHDDLASVADEHHAHHHHHHHSGHHHHLRHQPGRVEIAAPEAGVAYHAHWQPPFQRVAVAAVASVVPLQPVRVLNGELPPIFIGCDPPRPRARGPPFGLPV